MVEIIFSYNEPVDVTLPACLVPTIKGLRFRCPSMPLVYKIWRYFLKEQRLVQLVPTNGVSADGCAVRQLSRH